MPNLASWNHSGAGGCWSTEFQSGVYVLGAAWAAPAPNVPPGTAAAATQVAPASKLRLLMELDMKTSLGRGGRLLRMTVCHGSLGCQLACRDESGCLVRQPALFATLSGVINSGRHHMYCGDRRSL